MRKKEILGNFIKKQGILCDYEIKELTGEPGTYTALITFLPGTKESYFERDGKKVCLSAAGYREIVYMPMNEFWSITVFYNAESEILGWYFDISRGNFLDEKGMPCSDDIFLDLIILPGGQTITEDADELQEALDNSEITIDDYDHAWKIHDQIKNSKWSDAEFLTKLSEKLLADYNILKERT